MNLLIPRASLAWLLLAQALVMVPFWPHVPPWMIALWLLCTGWRVQMFRMRARVPGRLLKALLLVLTAAGVYLTRGSLIGLDAAAALLVATFVLKMLEMHSPRDARVLIFLGFFCVAVAYLFDASLLWALYSLLPLSALLAALIGLQQTRLISQPQATLRLALSLMAQALPLMLLLFVFFPRLEPLWSLPLPSSEQARIGLSDSMSPADVAELGNSTEVAFRASFTGPLPAKRELYWRALSLDRFDGRRWSQSEQTQFLPSPVWEKRGDALRYQIIQQPSGKPWLFALDMAEVNLPDARQLSDFRWQRRRPIDQALLYTVSSWPQALRGAELSEASRRMSLQLPPRGDARSREWAQGLKARYPEPAAMVQAILTHLNTQPFYYTLKPSVLGADSIDEFLFDSRRGFCAHYAGAMTFVLRAAGVPARMVVGYQGGEANPAGDYLTVHQYDAHAWVEYWQPGQGWRSVDPTAAVAPQRIEQGLAQALAADENFLAQGRGGFAGLRGFERLRLEWDNLNYNWQRWVLGYQGDTQLSFLQRWFQGLEQLILPLGGVIILCVLALVLLKPWRRATNPQLRQYLAFERLLARRGLTRGVGEGPLDFAARAAAQLPAHAEAIKGFAEAFSARQYGGQTISNEALERRLKALRRTLGRQAK